MRRLPLLIAAASPPPLSSFMLSSDPSWHSSLRVSASPSSRCGEGSTHAALRISAVGFSTQTASASHFTSFEAESELMWAQEDAREAEGKVAHAAQKERATTPLRPHMHVSLVAAASASPVKAVRETAQERTQTSAPPRPVAPRVEPHIRPLSRSAPTPPAAFSHALSPLLRRQRWRSAAAARRGECEPGFVEAAASTLAALRDAWQLQHRCDEMFFTDTVFSSTSLQQAHADALLTMIELVITPDARATATDTVFSAVDEGAAFSAALLPCLLQLLCRRHVELSGRHMAHLSRLLLSHPPLFGSAARDNGSISRSGTNAIRHRQQRRCATVWESFALLCYATRRQLRRKHNRDCLEALLWGVYAPLQSPAQLQQPQQATFFQQQHRHGTPRIDAEMWTAAQRGCVCHAALHHLLYRCLDGDAAADIGVQAAAHVDVLLAWSLLVAWEALEPAVRDAVIHRLCKRADGRPRRRAATCAAVKQWKQLALRLAATRTRVLGDRGTAGRAAHPAAHVFAAMERAARHSSGWAVAPLDRHLLRCALPNPTPRLSEQQAQSHTGASLSRTETPSAHPVSAVRSAQLPLDSDALRLSEGVRTTLRAYAQLRWGALEGAEAVRLPAKLAACAGEVEELVGTALGLPRHARCLSEAVAVRLIRCVRLQCAVLLQAAKVNTNGAPPPSLSSQLIAAFRRVAKHSRTDVVTTAVLMAQREGNEPRGVDEARRDSDGEAEDGTTPTAAAAAAADTAFTTAVMGVLTRQLTTAEEVDEMADVWAHHRSMATTALSSLDLARFQAWVQALPSSLRTEKLVAALHRIAQTDASAYRFASAAAAAAGAASPSVHDVWRDILFDAQPSFPEPLVDALPAPLTTATPASPLQRRTLQWTHMLNTHLRLEWQLSAIQHPLVSPATSAVTSTPPPAWPAVVGAVVLATEDDSAAQNEEGEGEQEAACLHHVFKAHLGHDATSWSVRCDEQWLRGAFLASSRTAERPSPSSTVVENGGETQAPAVLAPLPRSSQILRAHALPLSPAPSTVGMAPVQEGTWVPPALSPSHGDAIDSTDRLLLLFDWDAALHALRSHADRTSGDAEELAFAVSAFMHCFVGLWTAFRALPSLPTPLEAPHDVLRVSAVLMPHYASALHLLHALREVLDSEEEWRRVLQLLPDAMHLTFFRRLQQVEEPQWRQCEALLRLAESASRPSQSSSSSAPASSQNVGCANVLPECVYVEVLAAYAAAQRPFPPELRRWCEGAEQRSASGGSLSQ